MVKEAYVSLEVAKLLQEKGFDIECNNAYYNGRLIDYTMYGFCGALDFIFAPTQQMAMAWLREVRGLSVEIFSIKGTSNVCPVFWKGNVVKLLTQDRVFNGELVGSYEESVEAALKYTLENLI